MPRFSPGISCCAGLRALSHPPTVSDHLPAQPLVGTEFGEIKDRGQVWADTGQRESAVTGGDGGGGGGLSRTGGGGTGGDRGKGAPRSSQKSGTSRRMWDGGLGNSAWTLEDLVRSTAPEVTQSPPRGLRARSRCRGSQALVRRVQCHCGRRGQTPGRCDHTHRVPPPPGMCDARDAGNGRCLGPSLL